jgi:two-component system CheB/CheR fusion protein
LIAAYTAVKKLNCKMPEENKDRIKIRSSNLFPVVGIGASAGGLEAFKRLLKAIPENSGMAFILVQHLDPNHESNLTNLLKRVTPIPIREITDNIQVEANHIYIIPANKLLKATDGVLQLSPRLPKNQKNMPIDLFFASLAEVHQSHAIGIVLSGTATDGTLGLKAIKDHGGITFAQDQQSAAYDGMPQSAIDAEVVDFILPPEQIPARLLTLINTLKINSFNEEETAQQLQEDAFKQILSTLRIRRGVDFTYYKQTTIRRRITRRMALSMKGNIAEYLVYLKENRPEQDILFQDLLIPVTDFFRDPKTFENLCETIFPALLKDKPANEPLRIWIAGCSTGEEAYSMVMCLHEYLGEKASNFKLQVFATDLSEPAIAKARAGVYMKSDTGNLAPARLQQFFAKADGKFRLNKSIRDACVFAHHNFLKDPPFAKIDLISCRNALIYMEPFLQKKALTTFHYSLNDKGFLILGKSETTGQASDLFTVFDKTNKIYTRKPVPGKFLHVIEERSKEPFKGYTYGLGRSENNKDDFQKNADEILLSRYSPPGVIVNNELDIVQFRGATGIWLEPSPGKPSMNVLKMAREGLAFELRNALHKVKTKKESFVKEDISIEFIGKEHLVAIEVIPLLNTIEPHFLILFRDSFPPNTTLHSFQDKGYQSIPDKKRTREQLRIQKLEKELAQAREDMRTITEDQEAANEELQSANEELLSGSEELQSLNEELETSKEEIQTSNEELTTVNQELYDRNEQLNISRLYAESIVSTIREPLIILNKDLSIKSANSSFYTKFQTTEEDTEGKALFELGNNQWEIPKLRKMLEKMLPEKKSIVDFEVIHNFPSLGERILLLNATRIVRDNPSEQSILLAIEDITEKRKIENKLTLFAEELEKLVQERTVSLNEANNNLQHSNKNLEQFASIASHDLQEPLRKIRTFALLLRDRYSRDLPETARELIAKITSASDRMSSLIEQVLNFSKISTGGNRFERTDLTFILKKVINDFDLLVTEKNAVITIQPLPDIEAIPLQINQLFYNLLSNALKFSNPETPPAVAITSKMLTAKELEKHPDLDPKLTYYEICFEDNGVGFEQQFADQIFLIFHRLNGLELFSGTGIGLALCKKIAENHRGDIYAVSNENEGASFHIILPLKQ